MSWSSLVEGVIPSDPRGLRFEPGHQQHFIKNIVLVPNVSKRREKKPWMAIFKTNLNFTFHWILSRIDLCRIFCKQFLCSLSLSRGIFETIFGAWLCIIWISWFESNFWLVHLRKCSMVNSTKQKYEHYFVVGSDVVRTTTLNSKIFI